MPFALGWPRDDVACWLRALPLDDAATELLRRIDRETLSHLMLQAGMHTYPPKLVVASQEELVHLATAQLEEDHVKGRVVPDRTAAMLVAAAVALGASAASVARARALWPPMLGPRPRPPPDVLPPAPALLPLPAASSSRLPQTTTSYNNQIGRTGRVGNAVAFFAEVADEGEAARPRKRRPGPRAPRLKEL